MNNNSQKYKMTYSSLRPSDEAIERTLDVMNEKKSKTLLNKPVKIIAVSLAIVILLSISVFAGYTGYKSFISWKQDKQVSLTTELMGEVKDAPEYATLRIGYLPEGVTPTDDYQKYDYNGVPGLTFCLYKAKDISNFIIDNIDNYEECSFGTHYGAILRKTYDKMNKEFVIYFEDSGCFVRCFADKSIADEELVKIAESLKVESTDMQNRWVYDTVLTESVSQRAE